MSKVIFWEQGHSQIPCSPCPFMGVVVNSWSEFVSKVLQGRLFHFTDKENDKGWYPAVLFSTKSRDLKLVFSGGKVQIDGAPINPESSKPYKWGLLNTRTKKFIRYYNAKVDGNKMFSLFEDNFVVERKAAVLSAIVKRDDGLTIAVR